MVPEIVVVTKCDKPKRKRGRPPLGPLVQINVKLRPAQAEMLEAYRQHANLTGTRTDAVRDLLLWALMKKLS